MPGGDRTGPQGAGPMTGRGAGDCAGYGGQGGFRSGGGRGSGRGRGGGFGRGWRNRNFGAGGWAQGDEYARPVRAESTTHTGVLARLRAQASNFKGVLDDLEALVAELRQVTGRTSAREQKPKEEE